MHGWTDDTEELANALLDYARRRLGGDIANLGRTPDPEELATEVGQTITVDGLGHQEALRLFSEVLAPSCLSIDHPRYLSFIPSSPTQAAALFELVVGVSSIYAGSWLEGAGAVFAENQALRWLADLAGFPSTAGGVFVQGGTLGNLSALVAARYAARLQHGSDRDRGRRWAMLTSTEAHSSLRAVAEAMDIDLVSVAADRDGRLTGEGVQAALERESVDRRVFAVVATAGTTNLGIIDDLASVAEVTSSRGLWLHVDGAYGGAALAAPSVRRRFAGIEKADSLVVDPHKWLFAPFDCAALLYRDPALARLAHVQQAGYLEVLQGGTDWNPSDYALHLTRRARGLPFWFSVAAHGTAAYTEAIERTLQVARHAARAVKARSYLELLGEPELSVVGLRRRGWTRDQYYAWSVRQLESGVAFVTPTAQEDEAALRLAILNPKTTETDVDLVLDTLG